MNLPQKQPKKPIDNKILVDAIAEVKAMAKVGLKHPSMQPVLAGAVAGGLFGMVLPIINLPIGAVIGACIMLYKRIRP